MSLWNALRKLVPGAHEPAPVQDHLRAEQLRAIEPEDSVAAPLPAATVAPVKKQRTEKPAKAKAGTKGAQTIALAKLGTLSNREIAEQVGSTEAAVGVAIAKARRSGEDIPPRRGKSPAKAQAEPADEAGLDGALNATPTHDEAPAARLSGVSTYLITLDEDDAALLEIFARSEHRNPRVVAAELLVAVLRDDAAAHEGATA